MNTLDRFPTKGNCLAHIKEFFNDEIKTIIDVGVMTSTLPLIRTFKNQKHVLIEPVPEFRENIEKNYNGFDYDLLNIALSDTKGKLKLELINHRPQSVMGKELGVTASKLVFDDSRENRGKTIEVETNTLDNVCASYQAPFLVKIDVDGAEFHILEGAKNCLHDVFCFIVESTVDRIGTFINVMSAKGFRLWDIVDYCYFRGQLSQVDLVFVNENLFTNTNYKEISPRNFNFRSDDKGAIVEINENLLTQEFTEKLREISLRGTMKL